jgi:hypothetical protein
MYNIKRKGINMENNYVNSKHYIRQLEPWFKAAKKYIYQCTDRPDLEYYGCGYNNWGVQTVQKALAAFAVASVDPDFDEKHAGITKDELLMHAIKLFRFNTESHIVGSYQCTDGTKWGHTWISALGTERMMHGVDAIYEYLNDSDRELLMKVLESESNWLLDNYEIVAGLVENNRPESNLWNGSLLLRTALMFPELPRVDEYREKAHKFFINSISVPSDKDSDMLVDGKPVKDYFTGPQFFESYGLNHHRYMNVGYMVIPLSNLAMLHFTYKKQGIRPPGVIYHHAEDLWKQLKKMIFPDGRLLRIGGDSRVRYCYCQDYVIPMWLFIVDYLGDEDCIVFESNWLKQVEKEANYNNDGSFLSRRLKNMEDNFPLYYTRLESDRAVTLSMGAYWRRIFDLPASANKKMEDLAVNADWYDEYHGSCLNRGSRRVASFTWRACEKPQGLCLPINKSNMAEWWENISGQIITYGRRNYQNIAEHKEHTFPGGFLTYGKTDVISDEFMEGQGRIRTAINKLVFAVLPDDKTVIGMQYATSCIHNYYESIKGLNLTVPNDLYNDNIRDYYYDGGCQSLRGPSGEERILRCYTNWMNIDNCMGIIKVYGDDEITVYSPGRRQIGTHDTVRGYGLGFMHADHICFPFIKDSGAILPGTVLYDIGYVIRAGETAGETGEFVKKGNVKRLEVLKNTQSIEVCNSIRAMLVSDDYGSEYILAFNITDDQAEAKIMLPQNYGREKYTLCFVACDPSLQINNLLQINNMQKSDKNNNTNDKNNGSYKNGSDNGFHVKIEPWAAVLLKIE